jgi:hypothetical protein
MPLESGTYISDLVATNPVGSTDPKSQGDDHLRLIKATILNTFPNVDGAVTSDETELNYLDGATGVTGTGNTVRSASPTLTGTAVAAAITASGTVTAALFSGSGASLTSLPAGTESVAGALELATTAEVVTGADTARAVTPAGVEAWAAQNAGMVQDIADLADPGADRILFWDDSAGAATNLTVSNGLAISTTTLGVDLSSLTQVEANALIGGDEFLVSDGGTIKAMRYQDSGVPVVTTSAAATPADDDTNSVYVLTGSTNRAFTLNTGVGVVGNFFILTGTGTALWTLAGTAIFQGVATTGMFEAESVIVLLCVAANTWMVYGDAQ